MTLKGRPDTDLRSYSGRALLTAAAVSSSLHLALALAAPEWGGGRGLPMFRRPPLVVRLEMLRGTQKSEVRSQKSEPGSEAANLQERLGREEEGQRAGGRGQEAGSDSYLTPDTRHLTPVLAVAADGEEKGLLLAAQGGEGADSLSFAGGGAAGNLPLSPSPALPAGEDAAGGAGAVEMWEVEEPPRQVAFVEPEYPALARRMGVEGSVVVRYLVDRDGRVEQMAVLEGPELLREACLRAVGQFIYEPVYHRGRRTKVWMRQVVTFRLE